jgi:hypothetical protein
MAELFQLRVGQSVDYWSKTQKKWTATTIAELDLLQQTYKVGCKKNLWQSEMEKIRPTLVAGEEEELKSEEEKGIEDPFCYLSLLSS